MELFLFHFIHSNLVLVKCHIATMLLGGAAVQLLHNHAANPMLKPKVCCRIGLWSSLYLTRFFILLTSVLTALTGRGVFYTFSPSEVPHMGSGSAVVRSLLVQLAL